MGKEPSYVDAFKLRGGRSWNINLPPVGFERLLRKYCDELSLSADIEDEKNQSRLNKPAPLLLAERLRQAKERLEKGK